MHRRLKAKTRALVLGKAKRDHLADSAQGLIVEDSRDRALDRPSRALLLRPESLFTLRHCSPDKTEWPDGPLELGRHRENGPSVGHGRE